MVKSQTIEQVTPDIRINQIGYLQHGKKQAAVVEPASTNFSLINASNESVFEGILLETKYWNKSGEKIAIADFSAFNESGTYRIQCGETISHFFDISHTPYLELIKNASKSYYYNRASTSLDPLHSGVYHHEYAHPDTLVYVHASAASDSRPAGTVISTPYGWYDAGDYNKYVVNSGIATYTLIAAYQHNAGLFDSLTWNVPESDNQVPDLLDEILWNVRWMESMQDPEDGGVYHKTTTASFESFVAPSEATGQRYVVAKGTAATLDFAAVLAKSSVLFRATHPAYAARLLDKAEKAWKWASVNPRVPFENPNVAVAGHPAISTGGYGDLDFRDEFFWAATELYLATGRDIYMKGISIDDFQMFRVPSWASVETLGLISLSSARMGVSEKLNKQSSDQLMIIADRLINVWRTAPYKITLDEFTWGSNSDILNQGMVLINAYRLFGNREFYEAALSGLDYVLGRNATGYCFVTGEGSLSPKNVHHRPSASDGVEAPVPGMLVGGPNARNVNEDCGRQAYEVTHPARCYLDEVCSYSTNEVAINWNAPLVYMSSTLQATYLHDFKL
ncbi:MAG: glycoside hydrolase family 9 protein [Marinoscillum sp.]|uniref:glycoside hydrolase family 9 protein n=1 Tax=Marinoscillum sp. TaxID=2024838 RepID=UPI0032F98C05